MNIKLIALATAMAASAAMAQNYEEEDSIVEENAAAEAAPAQEEASEPAAAPAPVQQQAETAYAEIESKPAPQPVAQAEEEAPAADGEATNFDVLRGNAYNPVGNEAAASTIGGNMNAPYKMFKKNLVYLEPTGEYAALAFSRGALTYLLAFDNNNEGYGLGSIGFATAAFGLALDFSIDKQWTSKEESEYEHKTTSDKSITNEGDLLRLKFAAPLGAIDVAANIYWSTYDQEVDTEDVETNSSDNATVAKTTETVDNDKWDIGGAINVSNGPSGKNFFWSVGAEVLRHKDYTETETKINYSDRSHDTGMRDTTITEEETHATAYFAIAPYVNVGLPVLSSSNARVLLGLNTSIPMIFYDEIESNDRTRTDSNGNEYQDGNKDNHSVIGVYTQPNILAELGLGNCWMVFGGASFTWRVFNWASDEYIENYNSRKDPSDKETTETSNITMKTGATTVTAGARFQYKNFALEASVADSFFSNPLEGFDGSNFIANLGAFINF